MREMLVDESAEGDMRQKLLQTFRRRIDQLDIERCRIVQRLGTSLIHVRSVDQIRARRAQGISTWRVLIRSWNTYRNRPAWHWKDMKGCGVAIILIRSKNVPKLP